MSLPVIDSSTIVALLTEFALGVDVRQLRPVLKPCRRHRADHVQRRRRRRRADADPAGRRSMVPSVIAKVDAVTDLATEPIPKWLFPGEPAPRLRRRGTGTGLARPVRKLLPLIQAVLDEAELAGTDADGIAYPPARSSGALLVGAAVGSLLAAWGICRWSRCAPHGSHLLAHARARPAGISVHRALLVSGGHTLLADIESVGRYRILGGPWTMPCAAFDKVRETPRPRLSPAGQRLPRPRLGASRAVSFFRAR